MKKNVIFDHASQLTAGKISRRHFIMTALAAGASLPMAMTLATDAIAATPKKGGRPVSYTHLTLPTIYSV